VRHFHQAGFVWAMEYDFKLTLDFFTNIINRKILRSRIFLNISKHE